MKWAAVRARPSNGSTVRSCLQKQATMSAIVLKQVRASALAAFVVVSSSLTPATAATPGPVPALRSLAAQETPAAPTAFEVATVGSGSPEVFVWFGPDVLDVEGALDPTELAARRALVDGLRERVAPGDGRFHVLVAAGPAAPAGEDPAANFDTDFPRMELPGEPPAIVAPVFRRLDSRAVASYLVRQVNTGAGVSAVLRANFTAPVNESGEAQPFAPGSLERFAHVGLGTDTLPFAFTLADPTESLTELLAARDRARLTWRVADGGLTHLGGTLYQVDLQLSAPELAPVPTDPRRTYPRPRFELAVESSFVVPQASELVIEGAVEEASLKTKTQQPARVVELAVRAAADEDFGRVPRDGARFQLGHLTNATTLRVVLDFPNDVESVQLRLNAGRMGSASLELGNVRPEKVGDAKLEASGPKSEGNPEAPASTDG